MAGLLCESEVVERAGRQWLLEELQAELGSEGLGSRQLYRFGEGEPSKVNFHEYIDGRPNILALAKLANGLVVGAFTKFPFSSDRIEKPGSGFLFNLNRRSAYRVRTDPSSAVAGYDSYYLIFGNS